MLLAELSKNEPIVQRFFNEGPGGERDQAPEHRRDLRLRLARTTVGPTSSWS
ncbi:MAG: hypothetical protein HS111_33455 [Kofleriaceae bacterium]|nr:hypothetical protein [Kofleriaceae bacterium]